MFSAMIRLLENIKHPVILYNCNTEIGLLSIFLPGVVFARLFTMSNYSNIQFILTFNICLGGGSFNKTSLYLSLYTTIYTCTEILGWGEVCKVTCKMEKVVDLRLQLYIAIHQISEYRSLSWKSWEFYSLHLLLKVFLLASPSWDLQKDLEISIMKTNWSYRVFKLF